MAQGTSTVFTKTLSGGPFVVTAAMGLYSISIMLTTGTGTVLGTSQVTTNPPSSISLVANVPLNIESRSNAALTGLTIDATSGTILIVAQS